VRHRGVVVAGFGFREWAELRKHWLIRYPGTWEWVRCEKEVEQ